MIQIAIQSQMAMLITIGIRTATPHPAKSPAACASVSFTGVEESSGAGLCASMVAAVKKSIGKLARSRFMVV
jgi:hypothetical protein